MHFPNILNVVPVAVDESTDFFLIINKSMLSAQLGKIVSNDWSLLQ